MLILKDNKTWNDNIIALSGYYMILILKNI
jgi:hypothetical protein